MLVKKDRSSDKENIKILIVEDEILIALDIKYTVENLGFYTIGILSSGEEVIKKIPHLKPDFILMDIKLSGKMDGVYAAEKIYSQYHIPSIYISAYDGEKIYQQVRQKNQFYFINKPFSEHELSHIIRKTKERFGLV